MSVSYGGDSIVFADGSVNASGFIGNRNRIINGAMVIDQRNAGASVTNSSAAYIFPVDRMSIYGTSSSKFTAQQNAGAITPPVGYKNYVGVTSSAATSVASGDFYFIQQVIEGYNIADLGFGTASASTTTLSFWVRSSLTGTFGGGLQNSGGTYNYPFSYTISVANTWEQKTITITGATSGTWLATNGAGLYVVFGLGVGTTYSGTAGAWTSSNHFSTTSAVSVVGTNGATFYITGVQLERGSTASSFEYRSYGAELALCQRYYEKSYAPAVPVPTNASNNAYSGFPTSATIANGLIFGVVSFKVQKRADPTVVTYSYASSTVSATSTYSGTDAAAGSASVSIANVNNFNVVNSSGGTITPASGGFINHWAASSEL
jgi:hypothetical protein